MSLYDNAEISKIKEIQLHVENNSHTMDNIVQEIISPYCKELDAYVRFISDCLKDGNNPPTNSELEDFCINLSTYIYFAGGMCEQLGVRDSISKAVYKETYNTARSKQEKGTVDDKNTLAELASQQEQLVSVCYNSAYKTMKVKLDSAQELLSACKKALSSRLTEMELTKMTSNLNNSR